MDFKEKIHHKYKQLLQDRIDVFHDMITALTEDSKNDSKGSAGDKHETALSMMHIEQEKLSYKLREVKEQKAVFDKISQNQSRERVSLGSLVTANGIYLYVCAALPKVTVDGITVVALSPQSPLGEKLMGKSTGYSFQINMTQYVIEDIN